MDNALVIDGVLALLLLGGAVLGAVRGLFRSLMGLATVVLALVGALLLAGMLTEPITNALASRAEDAAVEVFADHYEEIVEALLRDGGDSRGVGELLGALDLPVPADLRQTLLDPLLAAVQGGAAQAKEGAKDLFRAAVSATVHTLVSGAVHAALVLVFYILLLIALKLLTHALDHVFDLPVLSTLNRAAGAALGLLEAALLAYVLVYAASHLGVKAVTEHAGDTILLPVFLNHSPVELLTAVL